MDDYEFDHKNDDEFDYNRHDFDQGGDLVQGEGMVLNAWENIAVQLPTVKDLVVIKMIKMLKMMIRS